MKDQDTKEAYGIVLEAENGSLTVETWHSSEACAVDALNPLDGRKVKGMATMLLFDGFAVNAALFRHTMIEERKATAEA